MVQLVKNLPANAGDARNFGSIPGLGRYPGVGNDNPLQYSCLENSMDRGAYLMGYSLQGHKELDTTEQLSTQTHRTIWNYIFIYMIYLMPDASSPKVSEDKNLFL